MLRRDFLSLLGSGAAAWPLVARAQPAMPLVGFLATDTSEGYASFVAAFRQGLQRTGFAEGRNVVIEYRYADNRFERLPALAADLIQRHPALIVSDPRATFALQPLTATIPTIFVSGSDPVRNGFVARLDRPGGNLTGIALLQTDLTAKRFGIFRDMVPQAATIGVLVDSNSLNREFVAREVEAAARTKGVPIRIIEVGTGSEIEAAFATFARDGVGAVFATAGFFLYSHAQQLAEQALRYRLPLTGEQRNSVEAGALMFYGPPLKDTWIQVGIYAGRILKGEKPGDLPVQLPTRFELVINLKTAKAIGFTVPGDILSIADEVIE